MVLSECLSCKNHGFGAAKISRIWGKITVVSAITWTVGLRSAESVQFEKKQHKITVFKARGKLADTTIGLDDDLTILQQQRKNAAWPAFKDFRSRGVKTQWRAEKLFVKEGEHFVEHKVLNL